MPPRRPWRTTSADSDGSRTGGSAPASRARRASADLADGQVPLLFLFDELLNGTNSHDRLVGAAGILRALLAKRAIGLVTTHDLALTAIADELAPRAVNVHLEDFFEEGEMRFDYRVKPGPVTRSNALALMRAVGLEVESGTGSSGFACAPKRRGREGGHPHTGQQSGR